VFPEFLSDGCCCNKHLLLIVSGFIPITFPDSYPPAPGGGGVLWVFGLLAAVQVTADSRFLSFV